ncbi:hypothetical protein TIFTF001_010892 [Ficus carica]|uniref:Uncharacterized protein n=1 Tax=Ficus carica TaxID=3494 RepID=A0AA88D2E7_FICCA|nr:hypothetical protein TIFTF001_010892 [Ficus carica]
MLLQPKLEWGSYGSFMGFEPWWTKEEAKEGIIPFANPSTPKKRTKPPPYTTSKSPMYIEIGVVSNRQCRFGHHWILACGKSAEHRRKSIGGSSSVFADWIGAVQSVFY